MRKILPFFIFISFLLKGCLEDAEMTPRYYPVISTEVKTDSLSGSVTFYGKIEEGTDSIVEYGFVYSLKEDTYLPGNFITFSEPGYDNYSLTLDKGLLPDTGYQVKAYAKTRRFTIFGNDVWLHTRDDEPKLKDIDGNFYHTIYIGNQEWMVENLRVTHYTNGDPLPAFEDIEPKNDTGTGAYGLYYPQQAIGIFGLLYNWYAVDDSRGLCPTGWRIPSDEDWIELEGLSDSQFEPNDPEWLKQGARGTDAGYHLRTKFYWKYSVYIGINHFGFRVLPGGIYDINATYSYNDLGFSAFLWSHSSASANNALYRLFEHDSKAVHRNVGSKELGMSVRCMRDVIFEPDFQ